MLLNDAEAIGLQLIALLIIAALLLAVAATPAYPLAIGIEVVALVYMMLHGGSDILKQVTDFSIKRIGA